MKIKLSEYVRGLLKEKNLTLHQVQERSGGAISFGYVNDILNEKSTNPSVKKLQALAIGLGVSEEQVFRVARGLDIEETAITPPSMKFGRVEDALQTGFLQDRGIDDDGLKKLRPLLEIVDREINRLSKDKDVQPPRRPSSVTGSKPKKKPLHPDAQEGLRNVMLRKKPGSKSSKPSRRMRDQLIRDEQEQREMEEKGEDPAGDDAEE